MTSKYDSLTGISEHLNAHFGQSINDGSANNVDIRKGHYLPFSNEDFHHLYEIVTSIVDTLSANNIDVPLGRSEKRQINHRKLVKERLPKE